MAGNIADMAGSKVPPAPAAWSWSSTRAARSVKFALLDPAAASACSAGRPRRSAPRGGAAHPAGPGDPVPNSSPTAATRRSSPGSSACRRRARAAAMAGAGHRVVHGGERFTASVLVDDDVIATIRSFIPLAPLHNPANLAGIEAVAAVRPDLPQVAVFDTAFHQTMPPVAYRYAVPRSGTPGTACGATASTASATASSAPGRRTARPAAARAASGHRPSRQRLQRGRGPRRRLRGHHDGPDPAGRPGHGLPLRRRRPRPVRLPGRQAGLTVED